MMNIYYRRIKDELRKRYHLPINITNKELLLYLITYKRLNDYIRFISCIDIDNYVDLIINNIKDNYYLYELLFYIDNKNGVLRIILNSNDSCLKYLIAKDIKGIDINLIIDSLIKDGSSKYLYLCALNIKEVDLYKIYVALTNIGDIYYKYLFERNILNKNVIDILNRAENKKAILDFLSYKEAVECLIYLYKINDLAMIEMYEEYILDKGRKRAIERRKI